MSATSEITKTIRRYNMLIDGDFVSGKTMRPVLNPATEEAISEVPSDTGELVDAAVLAAKKGSREVLRRRDFLKTVGMATAAFSARNSLAAEIAGKAGANLHFVSDWMEIQLSPVAPQFISLRIDGLGKGELGAKIVDSTSAAGNFLASSFRSGGMLRVEYRYATAGTNAPAAWTFEFTTQRIILTSRWSADAEAVPIVFRFNLSQVPSTVLGLLRKDKLLAAPALMHFPCQGAMRLTTNMSDIGLTYKSTYHQPNALLSLPCATSKDKLVTYTLEITAIYPEVAGISGDTRFDAFRRNWLNALQLNPAYPALANNTASDTCAFCYYEFADIAALTPPLAEGLTALDIVQQTLNRALAGGTAYGLPPRPWTTGHSPFSDTFPSLLIAAGDCVRGGQSEAWLAANYDGIKEWAETMLATDTNGDGLIKYSISGNSGIWVDGTPKFRPSNWWDTIGFGYEDAYANALAYRALQDMAVMAKRMRKSADVTRYLAAAEKIRAIYYKHFYDPDTGVLGGWRSADGQLHDYYFLWVNGIAIHYGLITKSQAEAIMSRLMTKMREVGYTNFRLGLPGNLVTVALKDCVDKRGAGRFGCGIRPDNSDGFQNYENGGATGAFAFFTLAALYDLGLKAEADKILFPMLEEYGVGGFERRSTNGRSNDWRRWDGTPMGYEGLLVDDYYALLAVPLRQSETRWQSGFRPQSTQAL